MILDPAVTIIQSPVEHINKNKSNTNVYVQPTEQDKRLDNEKIDNLRK